MKRAVHENSINHIFDDHNVSDNNVFDIVQHAGTDNTKFNKETFNKSSNNFGNQCAAEEDDMNQSPLTFSTYFWTLFASIVSFFLGGLCGI